MVVEAVLDAGAANDMKYGDWSMLLHHTARGGHMQVVEALLKVCVALGVKNGDEERPQHLAVMGGHTTVVVALLVAVVEVDVASENQQTLLCMAVDGLLTDTVRHMLDYDAAVNATDVGKWTPLHMRHVQGLGAAACGSYGCCRMLAWR